MPHPSSPPLILFRRGLKASCLSPGFCDTDQLSSPPFALWEVGEALDYLLCGVSFTGGFFDCAIEEADEDKKKAVQEASWAAATGDAISPLLSSLEDKVNVHPALAPPPPSPYPSSPIPLPPPPTSPP